MESIGIDWALLISQIVNFIIFIYVMKRLLYRPVLKVVTERQNEIKETLKLKADLLKQQEDLVEAKQRVIREAQEEAQLLLDRMKKDAEKVRAKLLKEARKERSAIIERAKREAELARRNMEKEMQQEAIKLAAMMTEKVLSNLLSSNAHKEIIEKELDILDRIKI